MVDIMVLCKVSIVTESTNTSAAHQPAFNESSRPTETYILPPTQAQPSDPVRDDRPDQPISASLPCDPRMSRVVSEDYVRKERGTEDVV
jgi:hypothetical protein